MGILIPNLGGFLVSLVISDVFASSWYTNLKQPPFSPPAWVFPVAWTIMYTLMGISSVLVYQTTGSLVSVPMIYYWTQLILNNLWSIINFKYRAIGWSFVEILALDVMVGFTISEFYRVDPLAGKLMLPYAGWLLIATTLNYSIWLLNRDNYLLDEYTEISKPTNGNSGLDAVTDNTGNTSRKDNKKANIIMDPRGWVTNAKKSLNNRPAPYGTLNPAQNTSASPAIIMITP